MPIDELLKAIENYEDEDLSLSSEYAIRKSPDQYAEAYNVAEKKGLPVDYVERNYREASRPNVKDAAPNVAQMLRDRKRAPLLIDDVDNLSLFEKNVQVAKDVSSMVPAAFRSISSAGYSILGSTFNTLSQASLAPIRYLNLATEEEINKGDWLGATGSALMTIAEQERSAAESYVPKKSIIPAPVLGGVKSAVMNVPAMAAGVVSRNPNIAASAMGSMVYGDSYLTAQQAGLDNMTSVNYAANQAIAELVTEKIPLSRLVKDIDAGSGFFATLAKQMATEIPTEQAATIWQDAIDWAVLNPDKTVQEFIDERDDAAIDTLISTVVATGLQTSAISGIDALARSKEKEQIQAIADISNTSKLSSRAPDVFAEYIQSVADSNELGQEVYIDAKEARLLMQSMDKDAAYDLLESQVAEAEAVGGDIVIPVGEFAKTIAKSKNFNQIKEISRLSPESSIKPDPDRINEIIKDSSEKISQKSRADEIHREITKQLISTGAMTADAAKTSAAIIPAYVVSRASRSGLSVDEVYEMMGVTIQKGEKTSGLEQMSLSEWDAFFNNIDYSDNTNKKGTDDETQFLSNALAGTRYTNESRLLKRVRKSSDQVFNELGGSAEAGRVGKTGLGQFSAYRTQAEIIESDRINPEGRLEVHVFGKEQDEKGLNAEPALTFIVSKDGELSVNGPIGETFDLFQKEGWAKESTGKAGEVQSGWTSLVNKDGSQMPLSQLLPLIADVHARVRTWRGDDKVGLHWSRSTGATGGIVGGRQTAVFFQGERGSFEPSTNVITLLKDADLSTFLHESGHLFLEMEGRLFNHPNATEQMKADGKVILDWLGLESFDQLKDYETNDVSREAHEKFARGFEKYLGEGKAPSVELKPIFRRFAAWLKQVYRDLRNLNVELTDEVRAVMDRMLATDEQIDRVRLNYKPLFASAKDAGMTEKEYSVYSMEASPDSAKEVLLSKMIRQLKNHYTKWWKDESASISRKVEKELLTNPLYSATEFLKGEHKITGVENVKLMKLDVESQLGSVPVKMRAMVSDDGVSSDEIATIFGFSSGYEMLDLIANEPTFKQKVKELTEAEMIKRHGDILRDGTIEEEAQEALRNPERAKMLVAELSALSRKTRKQPIDRESIKQYAIDKIGSMPFSKIRPDLYRAAEVRAAREAAVAKNNGDFLAAQKAKEQELINFYLSREAASAQQKAEKIRASQKSIQTKKFSNVDTEYVNQAKVLLSAYDFRKNSNDSVELAKAKLDSVRHWIESQQKDPESVSTFVKAEILGRLITYKEMTISDLEGLNDTVKSILHAGRRISEEDRAEYKLDIENGVKSIQENRIDEYKKEADTGIPWVKARIIIQEVAGSLRKMESLARQADGLNEQGWVWKHTVKPLLDAAHEKMRRQRIAHDDLNKLFSGFGGAFNHMKGIKRFNLSSGESIRLSYGARLSIALNMGNDGNYEALKNMTALRLNEQDISDIVGTLSNDDWNLVQNIWDYIDTYWKEISELEIKRSGVSPQKVLPRPFITPSGIEMRGGYYPLVGDQADGKQMDQNIDTAASAMMNGGAISKSTKSGSTIERTDFAGKKIDWSIGVLFNHIDSVLHDITHWKAVKDVDRVLKNKKVAAELTASLGNAGYKAIVQRLKEVAAGPQILDGLGWVNRFLRHARLASTYSALGYSVRTAIMNTMGLTTAIADMDAKQVAAGAIEYYSNIFKANDFILSKSQYMNDRGQSINRDVAYVRSRLRGDNAFTKLKDNAFWMMTQTDKAVTRPIWLAAYRHGETIFDTEQEAIDYADRMVARTQGSGLDLDLSNVETRSELMKTMTVMYTAFSAIYNIATEQIKRYKSGKINSVQLAIKLSWLTVVPGILTALLTGSDEEDDLEEMAAAIAWEVSGQALGMIPIARDAFSYAKYRSNFPTPIVRLSVAPIELTYQIASGEIDKGLVGSATEVASWAHIPGGAQLTRSYGYLSDLQDGEIDEFSVIDLLVTGKE